LDLIQRRGIERIEDQRARGIDLLASRLLGPQELAQFLHIGLVELLAQRLLPAGFELDAIIGHAAFLQGRNMCGDASEGGQASQGNAMLRLRLRLRLWLKALLALPQRRSGSTKVPVIMSPSPEAIRFALLTRFLKGQAKVP